MAIENVAIVNELGQVVNHIVIDTDDTETMEAIHKQWGTHRHVVTSDDDVIIIDESPEIWTTHCDDPACENKGFNLPEGYKPIPAPEKIAEIIYEKYGNPDAHITRKKSELPADSWLSEENASFRPTGWVFPDNMTIIDDEA